MNGRFVNSIYQYAETTPVARSPRVVKEYLQKLGHVGSGMGPNVWVRTDEHGHVIRVGSSRDAVLPFWSRPKLAALGAGEVKREPPSNAD